MLERLLGPYGDLEITEQHLAHENTAPEQVWDRWERLHPMWLSAREQLEGAGVTSPYLLATLERR